MGIQSKVILLVVISSILLNILLHTISILDNKSRLEELLGNKIEGQSGIISEVLSRPLYNYNSITIESIVDSYIKDIDIYSIRVKDHNIEASIAEKKSPETKINLVTTSKPILYNSKEIGYVEIVYTKDNIDKQILHQIIESMVSMLVITIIQVILLYILIKSFVTPINRLKEVTHDISKGNLSRNIELSRKDEIGDLANSIKRMQSSIKSRTLELKDHQKNLEEIIKSRTKELEDTQKMLVESAKMLSLGKLVFGIAHEINTPVGISLTASSHLEHESLEFKKLYEKGLISKSNFDNYLKVVLDSSILIVSSLEKASLKISNFKEILVDQNSSSVTKFNLLSYIDSTVFKLKPIYDNKIGSINIIDNNNDLEVKCDPGTITKILTILILNSIQHGFKDKLGIITISVEKHDQFVVLKYEDDGVGIDKDYIDKIFDPFYTTSRSDKSIGLGLSILYNLVSISLNGKVRCYSKKGRGTIFEISIGEFKE